MKLNNKNIEKKWYIKFFSSLIYITLVLIWMNVFIKNSNRFLINNLFLLINIPYVINIIGNIVRKNSEINRRLFSIKVFTFIVLSYLVYKSNLKIFPYIIVSLLIIYLLYLLKIMLALMQLSSLLLIIMISVIFILGMSNHNKYSHISKINDFLKIYKKLKSSKSKRKYQTKKNKLAEDKSITKKIRISIIKECLYYAIKIADKFLELGIIKDFSKFLFNGESNLEIVITKGILSLCILCSFLLITAVILSKRR